MSETLAGWTRTPIAGHMAELYEPPTPHEHGYTVIYLHGVHLQSLSGNSVYTQLFARHGLRVVSPQTGRSWWSDRICREFDPTVSAQQYVLESVLPFVRDRWGTTPPLVALLGTSMGGQGALRFSFKFPQKFPLVAALAPAVDYQVRYYEEEAGTLAEMYDSPEQIRQDTATLHIHPLNWPRNIWFCCDPTDRRWHESTERMRSKLAAIGIFHDCDMQTEAGGHTWAYYNHMAPQAIGYLMERFERERLRVP
ncbi:MAG TPA: alpha/beta hydrolase-fold protein [Pirellulales bacterium]